MYIYATFHESWRYCKNPPKREHHAVTADSSTIAADSSTRAASQEEVSQEQSGDHASFHNQYGRRRHPPYLIVHIMLERSMLLMIPVKMNYTRQCSSSVCVYLYISISITPLNSGIGIIPPATFYMFFPIPIPH